MGDATQGLIQQGVQFAIRIVLGDGQRILPGSGDGFLYAATVKRSFLGVVPAKFVGNTGGAALGLEIERVCLDNEWVIATWSPIHLRTKLKALYWKADKPAVKADDFWEGTLRYLKTGPGGGVDASWAAKAEAGVGGTGSA